MLGELHAWNAQANNQLMIFNRIIFCFVRVCPSVCVCRGCETRSPRHPLPKSLANTKEQPNSCYKAAHCEWFNIWAATSATRRAAWLGEEAKTLVASGQRRPFRRRDGIKKFALFSAQVCKSFQCADWFWTQCNNTIFITDEHKQQCSALNHFLIFCWNLESGVVTGRTWMNLF